VSVHRLSVGIKDESVSATETTLPRKTFLGFIKGMQDGLVLIEFDGVVYKMALSNIDKARLNPVF
jgi:ribosome maturation factor RimP